MKSNNVSTQIVKKHDEEKAHIEKFIERIIPRHLWPAYEQAVNGMKAGFYEGIKFMKKTEEKKQLTRIVGITLLAFLLFVFSGCTTAGTTKQTRDKTAITQKQKSKPILARITVYWAKGKGTDYNTRRFNGSWIGYGKLREGHCAVDPRKIKYGSKIRYPDGTVDLAADTGSAVKKRKAAIKAGKTPEEKQAIVVDKFFVTKNKALAWARSRPMFMPIEIIPPGSENYQESNL